MSEGTIVCVFVCLCGTARFPEDSGSLKETEISHYAESGVLLP